MNLYSEANWNRMFWVLFVSMMLSLFFGAMRDDSNLLLLGSGFMFADIAAAYLEHVGRRRRLLGK